jgi:hypothetical protein
MMQATTTNIAPKAAQNTPMNTFIQRSRRLAVAGAIGFGMLLPLAEASCTSAGLSLGGININLNQYSLSASFSKTLRPGDSWGVPFLGSSIFNVSNDVNGNVRVQKSGHIYYNSNGLYTTQTTNISGDMWRATVTVSTYPNSDPQVRVSIYARTPL